MPPAAFIESTSAASLPSGNVWVVREKTRGMGRPPVHDRQALVVAAADALRRAAYTTLRYRDVSDVSGVPVSSIRHYFPQRDNLQQEALLCVLAAEIDAISTHLSRPDRPAHHVHHLVGHSLKDHSPSGGPPRCGRVSAP